MKKGMGLAVLAFVLCASRSTAQLKGGNMLVGGNISDISLNLNENHAFSFTLSPKAAWFIGNNLALGGYTEFGLTAARHTKPSFTYGLGPLARYYFGHNQGNLTQHVRIFLEGNFGIDGTNPGGEDESTNGFGLGIGPGVTYFLTSNVGLEAMAKYKGILGFGSSPTSNTLLFNLGFQIYMPSAKMRRQARLETGKANDKL